MCWLQVQRVHHQHRDTAADGGLRRVRGLQQGEQGEDPVPDGEKYAPTCFSLLACFETSTSELLPPVLCTVLQVHNNAIITDNAAARQRMDQHDALIDHEKRDHKARAGRSDKHGPTPSFRARRGDASQTCADSSRALCSGYGGKKGTKLAKYLIAQRRESRKKQGFGCVTKAGPQS